MIEGQTEERRDPDSPYRLKDIIPLAYPNGGMTISGLRREIAKGNLEVEYVAGRFFVTLRAIEEMRRKCLVRGKARAYGSGKNNSMGPPESLSRVASGSSSTPASKSPQESLAEILRVQKENLRATSSTKPGQGRE